MRKTFLIIAILFSGSFSHAQNKSRDNETKFQKKLDSLTVIISDLKKDQSKQDTMVIKLDQLAETFKKNNSGWVEKILPSLFALLTVAISSFVAYRLGIKNINVQKSNTEKQTETQLSIAADNLFMSKEQLDQNTKNTLAQIRSNNISKARIEWIQNLRPLLSDFFANVTKTTIIVEEAGVAKRLGKFEEVKRHIESMKERMFIMEGQHNQITLFLNPDKPTHRALEDSITALLISMELREDLTIPDNNKEVDMVIEKSRMVLKEAWEKAKSETGI